MVYDYIGHFKKFGLKWKQDTLGLEYSVKIDSSDSKKIQKKITLSSSTRKKICRDQSRIWTMKSNWKFNDSAKDWSRLSYLIGYLENETMLKSLMGIDGSSFDFTRLSAEVKTSYLYLMDQKCT